VQSGATDGQKIDRAVVFQKTFIFSENLADWTKIHVKN
jgi:hypothetical protein